MACRTIDVEWRRLIALAVYLFPRAGELGALEWEDVDVERRIIHIHRGTGRERVSATSSRRSRCDPKAEGAELTREPSGRGVC